MPELPEVEVLVRHLHPLLCGSVVQGIEVHRAKVLAPTSSRSLTRHLKGGRFVDVRRRGKFIVFELRRDGREQGLCVLGHLGMTGRMYLLAERQPLPKHAAVVLSLGKSRFVFEDTRYFGKFTLDLSPLRRLGPEPLESDFTPAALGRALARSRQPIKAKLLDQSLVAGIGNIYASEALFRARISPHLRACKLSAVQVRRLWRAIRKTLREAIQFGSTVPLNYGTATGVERLFYFGRAPGSRDYYRERLRVYDRQGLGCYRCGASIKRIVQGSRSTFYCPECQQKT